MADVKFTVPVKMPGLNEYTAACRKNKYAGADMKKESQHFVEWAIRSQRVRRCKPPVRLHFLFYEQNKRRDHDNVSGFAHKVIQDALVTQGILPDDGWNEVVGYTDDFLVDKHHPRIEITIEEEVEEKMSKVTQEQRILRHFEEVGGLTSAEAMQEYGIYRLASRIADLRQSGHTIADEWVTTTNRFGEQVRFKRYYMR